MSPGAGRHSHHVTCQAAAASGHMMDRVPNRVGNSFEGRYKRNERQPLLADNAADAQRQQQQQPTQLRIPTDEDRVGSPPPSPPNPEGGSWAGWQLLVALATMSMVICYADRSNMSTAILPMAQTFGWDKAYQGVVLSAFFGGYAATQILGGQLADRFGGKMVLTGGVALWSLFTIATPAAAAAGTASLLAARVCLGVGEGVAFPAIHSLVARNVPSEHQSTAVALITAASYGGTALAFGLAPLIISNVGWEWVFYLFGGSAALWLPFWLPLSVANNIDNGAGPVEEREARSSTSASSPAGSDSKAINASGVGFNALMRCRPVWAICLTQYAQSYGMYGLLTWLPSFFNDVYHIQLADLGSYTLLPYLVQGGMGAAAGVIADRLIARGLPVRKVRVGLQVVGMLGPAACLLLAVSPAVGASPQLASQLITLGLGLSALTLGGVSVNHLDIAPAHAGAVFGAGNTAATLAGLVAVPATGLVLQQTGSWPLVFGIIAAHYVVGAGVWAAWATDKRLPEDGVPQPATR